MDINDPNQMMHGPGASAERTERRMTSMDKVREKAWYQERQRRLETQNLPDIVSEVFKDVSVYFSGYTESLSFLQLKKMVQSMRGQVKYFFAVKKVTHIVCANLCGSKTQHWSEQIARQHNIHIVHPNWVRDCFKAKDKLKKGNYAVLNSCDTKITEFLDVQPNLDELAIQDTEELNREKEEAKEKAKEKEALKELQLGAATSHPLKQSIASKSQRRRHPTGNAKLDEISDQLHQALIREPVGTKQAAVAKAKASVAQKLKQEIKTTVTAPSTLAKLRMTSDSAMLSFADVPSAHKSLSALQRQTAASKPPRSSFPTPK